MDCFCATFFCRTKPVCGFHRGRAFFCLRQFSSGYDFQIEIKNRRNFYEKIKLITTIIFAFISNLCYNRHNDKGKNIEETRISFGEGKNWCKFPTFDLYQKSWEGVNYTITCNGGIKNNSNGSLCYVEWETRRNYHHVTIDDHAFSTKILQ